MVASVNKYNGFYIGRYETTIDENNQIGSVCNTTVLTANAILKEGTNPNISSVGFNLYYYRWYGLYYAQRNSNAIGNNNYLQTNMICGQEWDAMLDYFDSKSIDYSAFGKSMQGTVVNSGQSTNDSGAKDEIYNIYDLRTNGREWTVETRDTVGTHVGRGGYYLVSGSASKRTNELTPVDNGMDISSRLTLYIK